jgi:hypothetical protein
MTFSTPFESLISFYINPSSPIYLEVESIVNISVKIREFESKEIFLIVIWAIIFEDQNIQLVNYQKEIGAQIIKTGEMEEDLPVVKDFIRQTFTVVQNDFGVYNQPINPPSFLAADKQAADVLIDLVKRGFY